MAGCGKRGAAYLSRATALRLDHAIDAQSAKIVEEFYNPWYAPNGN
jgi:hypothetical protein